MIEFSLLFLASFLLSAVCLLIGLLIVNHNRPQGPQQPLEVTFMYVVKDDNPDVKYSITLGQVKDSKGDVIPADPQVSVEVGSDNADVVSVAPNPDGRSGSIHFGNPGQANITANVKDPSGKLLGTGAASFTVTTGDPASISGVSLAFEGLTEKPAA